MSLPEVTMIVVSWNVREALRTCLKSIENSRDIEPRVVVIDNDSSDGSADLVRREFPTIELIANSQNRGFAAAVNQGLTRASGHVILINPDLEIEPDTVARMCAVLDEHQTVGIVGPRLIYPDGAAQPSVKRFPRWIDLALVLSKLPNIMPRLGTRYNQIDFDYDRTQIVDQVMGSCFMVRRQTLDAVGEFDQGFWIWFEEVDYCRRAKRAGWDCLYLATTTARHGRGQSFRQLTARRKQALLRRSISHYVRKHFGWLAAISLVPFELISWLAAGFLDLTGLSKPKMVKDF